MNQELVGLKDYSSNLIKLLDNYSKEEILENIKKNSDIRFNNILKGVDLYHKYNYQRKAIEGRVIWQSGSCRLIDYCYDDVSKPIILFIPSLINKSYILNLNEDISIIKFMRDNGFRVLLIDWDNPIACEENYNIESYINHRITPILDFIENNYNNKLNIVGYCMGGIMSIIASLVKKRDNISSLILMAMPWDFDIKEYQLPKLLSENVDNYLRDIKYVSPDMIQLLFYYISPRSYLDRYIKLADIEVGTSEANNIIAIEQWSNDGIYMTSNVVKDCLKLLCRDNLLVKGEYEIAGHKIDISKIDIDICVVTASKDRIVPAESSNAIFTNLDNYYHIKANVGHVSLVASNISEKELWIPLYKWIKKREDI